MLGECLAFQKWCLPKLKAMLLLMSTVKKNKKMLHSYGTMALTVVFM